MVIGEREGKVDNKTRIELIKEEVAKIKEEKKEEEEATDTAVSIAFCKFTCSLLHGGKLHEWEIVLRPALQSVIILTLLICIYFLIIFRILV